MLFGDDDNGPAGSPTLVSDLLIVSSTRVAPITFSFHLNDQQSDAANVAVSYTVSGGHALPALLVGSPSLTGMATSPGGTAHVLQWDFATQLPTGHGLATDVRLLVRLAGAASGSESALFDVGNDAPSVGLVDLPQGEQSGVIPIVVLVEDSSSDFVTLEAEYDDALVPTGWKPATSVTPPMYAASPGGTAVTFFWDSAADEPDLRIEALLRFVPDDGFAVGAALLVGPIEIDNDAEPVVQLDGAAFFATPDERRGIPLPFHLFDTEAGPSRVFFQWRAALESFPLLPATLDELDAALLDPIQRQTLRIASERPVAHEGAMQPVGPRTVRLPELRNVLLPPASVPGKTLELLRVTTAPGPAPPALLSTLVAPLALVPLRGGEAALVLDAPSPGSWCLKEIDLVDGAVLADVACGNEGDPSALFRDADSPLVWIATDGGGPWSLLEIDTATGSTVVRHASSGAALPGPVRALATVGSDSVWVTVSDALASIDLVAGTEQVLIGGLASPLGLCRKSRIAREVYLSERDWVNPATSDVEGRVLVVDRLTLATTRLAAAGGPTLARPSNIALEGDASRLLVVTDDPLDATLELRGITLRGEGSGTTFQVAADLLPGAWAIATGTDRFRALIGATPELLLSGGVQQSREIVAYAPASAVATVAADFDPPPTPSQRWRIVERVTAAPVAAASANGVFVWDSADLPGGGSVVLRAVPYDVEQGLPSDTGTPRTVKAAIDVAPTLLGGPGFTDGVLDCVLADFDGDGIVDVATADTDRDSVSIFFGLGGGALPQVPDLSLSGIPILAPVNGPVALGVADLNSNGRLDLVSCNRDSNNVTFFLQGAPRSFTTSLTAVGVSSPAGLAIADFSGDGLSDLAVASTGSDRLAVFNQLAGGLFSLAPSSTPGTGFIDAPVAVASADFDSDGDPDLVCANRDGNDLTVFLNTAGTFAAAPSTRLGGPGTTVAPSDLALGDIDGDGRIDIAGSNRSGNDVTVFLGLAGGSFSVIPTWHLSSPVGPVLPDALALLDLSADGFLDVVALDAGNELVVFRYDDTAQAFAETAWSLDGDGALVGSRSLSAGDVDGDGLVDLAISNQLSDDVALLVQREAGSFAPFEPDLRLGSPLDLAQVRHLATADIDRDGLLDLLTANEGADTVAVFRCFSPGVFPEQPSVLIGHAAGLDAPSFVACSDVSGDGRCDIVIAGVGVLAVWVQASDGSFPAAPSQLVGAGELSSPTWVELADLDADGDSDLVCADAGTDRVHAFLGDGSGAFAQPSLSVHAGVAADPSCLAVADLDADGDLDLVTANAGSDDLGVFFALSPGVLPASPSARLGGPGSTAEPSGVVAFDADGDGHLDLASANTGSDSLTVFLQHGGAFSTTPDIVLTHDALQEPASLAVGDLDDGGLADLVTTSASRLLAFRQVAPGHFAAHPTAHGGPGFLNSLKAALVRDIDGDGDRDIAAVDPVLGELVLYFNSH